ncbi:thioredoxin domain-containing protein [Stackebrandtia soli]|uniref:thioredoxin domain-containing protein n=1 Tax=Stackebrandtia soli TaxID=1892856 RepID=UPI0039E7C503
MNRLVGALSPYLQQHAGNPVDWWQWGEEALAEARRRDLPVLISVGYAACHWCHVMAHESFEDDEVAAKINALTVPVKVDREERPDVDSVYMAATVAMTGQGGWPMTVFAFPDGTPFYAGTYYPKDQFLRLLDAVHDAWTSQRPQLTAQGTAIVEACASSGPPLADVTQVCPIDGPCPPVSPVDEADLLAVLPALDAAFDERNGGFGRAPKFPNQPALAYLARLHDHNGDSRALEIAETCARRMARGGIYDQLAGGFARYSVDSTWTVPHFEKMLYDNALLLSTYTDLYRRTEDDFFRRVAEETARFVIDDLGTDNGGFASALDADTEGTEGATYVWTPEQLTDVLGDDDGAWAAETFGVTSDGTFEHGTSVLRLLGEPDPARLADVRDQLAAARRGRPQPARDDKIVAVWNAFAVIALGAYAEATGDEWADSAADRAARLLADLHVDGDRLYRVSRDGRRGDSAGVLEDYAATVLAFASRGTRSAGDDADHWFRLADTLAESMTARFTADTGAFFDTAHDAEALVHRPSDTNDGPTPSGWALAVSALSGHAVWAGERGDSDADRFHDTAWRGLAAVVPAIRQQPRFTAGLATAAFDLLV